MIDNSNDNVGSYKVEVFAKRNCIAGFYCPSLADARYEAARITHSRLGRGLQTSRVVIRQIIGKRGAWFKGHKKLILGPDINNASTGRSLDAPDDS